MGYAGRVRGRYVNGIVRLLAPDPMLTLSALDLIRSGIALDLTMVALTE